MKHARLIRSTLVGIAALLAFAGCGKSQRAEKQTADEVFSIEREAPGKRAFLVVNAPGKWSVYAGASVGKIDMTTPLLEGAQTGRVELPLKNANHAFFRVKSTLGETVLAERHLPMAGGYNFRDLGGYKTADGKRVRWGRVFRTDDLNKLTTEDLAYLASVPITSIVDFRSESEIKAAPDLPAPSVRHQYAYSITPGNLTSADDLNKFTKKQTEEFMIEMNRLFVTDERIIGQYRKFFKLLQDEGKLPLMFHCSAGKDRTGMGAALFLASLGVDEKTIFEDYLLSNRYLAGKYDPLIKKNPQLEPLYRVSPEFLRAGFEQMKKDHGSVENYLRKVLQVDLEKMRSLYLD
ncbi:protein-tyrosine phosphatase [Ereboglobus sp. PH5-5]|uniref:tyrosine-protein phosphatase n=1 Tax=Ereboglobus sp. PH5-5 TaxID=2940529 RepID=UPI002405B479|nr:tyrosine-protein phosphatase [Ereboglobus sp. PH5-5]MDF9834374.1 protein-tyrosine phosphatase [Ereboglobus sp. PH5-5]